MNSAIRTALPNDAIGIARVSLEVWPDEPLDAVYVSRLIAERQRTTHVAELDGQVVGFVDGFQTETASAEPRWEVDLLAVSPRAQGHGIGKLLVRTSLDMGTAVGATSARGLIRVDNVASERVFAACGFKPDTSSSHLWVGSGLRFVTEQHGMHVVRVSTFLYEGIWLEEVNVAGLRLLHPSESSGSVGAVISATETDSLNAAAHAGLTHASDYRFWTRRLS